MILLRVDFGSEIGFGHLKRSEKFIQWKIENKKREIDEKVFIICQKCEQKYTDIPIIKIKNENEFFDKVKKLNPDEVIVDNYNFTYENEKKFKELFPNIKLVCFDDVYRKHYCDEIINVNLYAKAKNYNFKVPEFTKINILKPLIRDEFKNIKKKKYKKNGIFVSLGATDVKDIGCKLLKQLIKTNIKIDFYTTSANKNLNKLKRFCRFNNCNLHIDENIAEGMAKAKFGIITPSSIAWEAIYMDLPFIAIEVADNQKLISRYLKQKRYSVLQIRDIRKINEYINRYY